MLNIELEIEEIGKEEAINKYFAWLFAKRFAGKMIGKTFPKNRHGLPMPFPTPKFQYQIRYTEVGELRQWIPYLWECCDECNNCEIDWKETFYSPTNDFLPASGRSWTETVDLDTRWTDLIWGMITILLSF